MTADISQNGNQPLSSAQSESAQQAHARLRAQHAHEEARHELRANRYSLVRLFSFVGGAALLTSGVVSHDARALAGGVGLLIGFAVAIALHARTLSAQTRARVRREIHERHEQRMTPAFSSLPNQGVGLLPRNHPYALDLDLLGRASLYQRIDVTHTRDGQQTLASWLGYAASENAIFARQAAVRELSGNIAWRQELEATAGDDAQRTLDPSSLDALTRLPSLFAALPSLRLIIVLLPLTTLAVYIGGKLGLWPSVFWLVPCIAQIALLMRFGTEIRHTLDLVRARTPVFEAFEQMLLHVEKSQFSAALLLTLQKRIAFGDTKASSHLRRIATWASYAELRQNAIFHLVINTLTLWDLHVLWGIERCVRDVGKNSREWFLVLGELEALSSLATLAHGDATATFPELVGIEEPFLADAIAHPLLSAEGRIANDVTLRGPGSALVITGSNMAGKSTLLRAVGQNIALALAGGPVIAERMRVPRVRLRASMRADDSLEAGSSYFHAELERLKGVVESAAEEPPVFFLLDELLRGTNARARHIGAKAVLMHLIDRRAMGLCATHDVELAALENEHPARIGNVHFTDVVVDGEMRFDYKLRAGIVRTSNALRLLRMAGIDVPEADREALASATESGLLPVAQEGS